MSAAARATGASGCACLAEDELQGFIRGTLDGPRRIALRAHLPTCRACGALAERARCEPTPAPRAAETRGATLGAGPLHADPGAVPEPPRPSVPGYDVLRLVHRGGQGAVYEAVQLSTRRRVALKVLTGGALASPQAQRRFEREIDLAATLNHPNIVTIHDSGLTNGLRYLVMELVEGEDLDAWLRRTTPCEADALRLFIKICEAVHHAHQRGVIHRDLKPGNIRIDTAGEPRVLDFGLARPVLPGEEAGITRVGVFVGTLTHASPEQLRGDSRAFDTRTDVYSLGVILYEMLTGELPLLPEGDLGRILATITREEPLPPSRRRTGLSRDADAVVMRALAKLPEDRYATVDALRSDALRCLAGDTVEARRGNRWYVVRKTVRRHRLPLAAAAALFALLFGAFVQVRMERDSAVRARREAQSQAVRATLHAKKSEEVTQLMLGLFEDAYQRTTARLTVGELVDQAAQRSRERTADRPDLRLELSHVLAGVYMRLGRVDEALAESDEELSLCRQLGKDRGEDWAAALMLRGNIHFGRGEPSLARPAIEAALDEWRRTGAPATTGIAGASMNLGAVLGQGGDHAAAAERFREAVAAYEQLQGRLGTGRLQALSNLGLALEHVGDLMEAERLQRSVIELKLEAGEDEGSLALNKGYLARVLGRTGRAVEAVLLERENCDTYSCQVPGDSTLLAGALAGLAEHQSTLGAHGEAERSALEGQLMARRVEGPGSQRALKYASVLADVLHAAGELDAALAVHRVALDEFCTRHGAWADGSAVALRDWAAKSEAAGRHEEARSLLALAQAVEGERAVPSRAQ